MKRQDASTGKIVDDHTPAADSGAPSMHVRIYSPFKIFFDEAAASLSGSNQTGPFDILPHHHNFITLLNAGELVVRRANKTEQKIRIAGAVMHVKADKVTVFLDV